MPRKFYLTSRPGCDLVSAIENPDYDHSQIIEVDTDGTIIGNLPFLPDTEYMYDPEPDPRYIKPQYVVTTEGEVEIPRLIPEDRVAVGENPFVQLIYRYAKKMDGVEEEDVIRFITREKQYLPPDKYGLKRIKDYIKSMHKGSLSGLLVSRGGKYHAGVKMELGRHLVEIKAGYDPIEREIMSRAENKGIISRDEIHRMLVDKLKWARNTSTVEFYILRLIKLKYLKKVTENFYEFRRPLEPNT